MKALLFSGGIDSTAIAWMERPDALLFIDYGQLAAAGERRAASAIAEAMNVPLDIRGADLSGFGSGTMVGGPALNPGAPEFWPFRNQMLVTLAAMTYAGSEPVELVIGTVASDGVHPDGSDRFIAVMDAVLSAQGSFRLSAPAIGWEASDLLRRSQLPRHLLGWTFSCHTGEWACGQCRGCLKHDELKRWHVPA